MISTSAFERLHISRLVCLMAAASFAAAAEFHVAPNGSDSNPGSSTKPFATLTKARDSARTAPAGAKRIVLGPGRYFLTEPLKLDERDSGTVWSGSGKGAAAEIYGGVPITGWEKWKGGIWRATVPKDQRFFNLIVDGKPAVMAQTPNHGSGFRGGAGNVNNGAISVPPEWRGYDYSDAQVFTFIGANWFSEMRAVSQPSPNANGILPIDGGSGQFGGMNGRFFLRGVLEFLDEPGEWCLKHREGYVYYCPENGTTEDHVIVRPVRERAIEVRGRSSSTPAKGVTFENLSIIGSDFCHRWYLFQQPKDGTTPEPLQQGMIFGENVAQLTIRGCRLLAAGHSAVWLNKHARDCVVEENLITGAGFAGIYMNGWDIGEGPFKSAEESYVNRGHQIEGNFIHDCGKFVGAGCGVQFYQSGDNLIARNEIGQMPRYGISYKGNRWGQLAKEQYGQKLTFENHYDYLHTRNNRIIGNDIYSVCRNSFDYGGIESWSSGRDNLWENNAVHDLDQTLQWDGWAHIVFADDSSHYLTTRNNILYHCHGGAATGAFMMKSIGQEIANNIVADCAIGRLVTLTPYIEPGWDFTVRRNVFAVDGRAVRYDTSKETFTGMAGTRGSLPQGVTKGIREVDFNAIAPKDPANPNPAPYPENRMDRKSFFGDVRLRRAKPEWDIQYADYSLAPDSPAFKLGFKAIPTDKIGLKPGFPFDKLAVTRRPAMSKIQAEDYQRMKGLRTAADLSVIGYITDGSWTKYSNIDFADGKATKAFFKLDAPAANAAPKEVFVRRYDQTLVEATPFLGDKSVETITRWEISTPYQQAGKAGKDLFDVAFPPEQDPKAGTWKPVLASTTSRAGVTSGPGVVDLDVANGENHSNSCAYMRASIYAPTGRTNATMTVSCGSGVKVWLNGDLIIAKNKPGTYSETTKGIIKQGWNTILIKVNQDNQPWTAKTQGDGNFWAKFGTVASGCGEIVHLPGLATEEKAAPVVSNTLAEIRLDAPDGKLIGRLVPGSTSCPVERITGVHNVFLVFRTHTIRSVDFFGFE